MIALLASVPFETELLRRSLSPCEVRRRNGYDLYCGTLGGRAVCLLHTGVGKANAAAAVAGLLVAGQPEAVFVLGCGGACPGSGLDVGDLALASLESYGDEGVSAPQGFIDMESLGFPLAERDGHRFYSRFPVDPALLAAARACLEQVAARERRHLAEGPFVTVSTCSGTAAAGLEIVRRTGGICENMEGAAAAQICTRHGIPFLEIRGISNLVEDRDLRRWDLRRGAEIAQMAVLALLAGAEEEAGPA